MKTCNKLNPWAFGLALGVVWGVSLLMLSWICWGTGWAQAFVETIGSLYIGYAASFVGGIWGLIWGFVDMFIGGVIIAWLYNVFLFKKKAEG